MEFLGGWRGQPTVAKELEDLQRQLDTANKEQEASIDIFLEERSRRDEEEENLRQKLNDALNTIQELLEKLNAARKGQKMETNRVVQIPEYTR